MKNAIIIMAKVPGYGNVMTRMQPFLSVAQCRELSVCLLKDTEKKISELGHQTIVAFAPATQKDELKTILQHQHLLIEQQGAELGDRMYRAFRFAFDQGFESVMMIGTDSPTIPRRFVTKAFKMLGGEMGAVLGKSEDGGFYLIGLRSLSRKIFEGVEWGTENVFRQTVRNIEGAGFSLQFTREWYDVDKPDDLLRLKADLENNPALAPSTFEWLKNF